MFKKTVKLEDFIRSLIGLVITAEPVGVLTLKDNFNFEELVRIKAELSNFRMVILALFLLDKTFRDRFLISEQEMGRLIGQASIFACQDKGINPARSKEWLDIFSEYLDAILKNNEEEIRKRGIYFFACECFSSKLLPNVNLKDEAQRLRRLALFDAAKQVYQVAGKAFLMANKKVHLSDVRH